MSPEAPVPCRLRRSIALVGLMGCGKTTVGARLAKRLGAPFADADAEIVKAAGMSIPEIFERYGEGEFRDGERRVIARLMSGKPMVLATGGGAYMDPDTRRAIREAGAAVWLHADLETLLRRTGRKTTRPLLRRGDPRQILSDLMKARYPVYAEAEMRAESRDEATADQVAAEVQAAIRAFDASARPEKRLLEAEPCPPKP